MYKHNYYLPQKKTVSVIHSRNLNTKREEDEILAGLNKCWIGRISVCDQIAMYVGREDVLILIVAGYVM